MERILQTTTGLREIEVFLQRGEEKPETVDSLFDGEGSETFDPTRAVEALCQGLTKLEPGDEITVRLRHI